MTVSVAERAAAIKRVLFRLSEMFWDEYRGNVGDADFSGTSPLRTTLTEMQDKRLIELESFLSNPQPYLLTKDGWFTAQRVAGRFDAEDCRVRRARFCAALKRTVKDRQDEVILDFSEIAQLAGLPEGWVGNIIEGQTLYALDPRRRYWLRFENGVVFVPSTFGQVEVSLD